MKLPHTILGFDKGAGNDFTVFSVIQLTASKKETGCTVDLTVLEAVTKDYRNLPKEEADELFEKEKKRLMEKYSITDEPIS